MTPAAAEPDALRQGLDGVSTWDYSHDGFAIQDRTWRMTSSGRRPIIFTLGAGIFANLPMSGLMGSMGDHLAEACSSRRHGAAILVSGWVASDASSIAMHGLPWREVAERRHGQQAGFVDGDGAR